jgi:hypothetical protein
MTVAERRIGLALGLVICVVASVILLTSLEERPKLGPIMDCFYLMGDGVVTATPIPGCPTRPPGRPGPSLTPPEERERLLRDYPHG